MYKNMYEIYKRNPSVYPMAVGYLLDKGFTFVQQITDEEIDGLEGNGIMTENFVKDLVRTARDIARECDNSVVEVIQFCAAEEIFDTEYYTGRFEEEYEEENEDDY